MPPAAAIIGAAVGGIAAGAGAAIAGITIGSLSVGLTASLIGLGSFVLNLAGSMLQQSMRSRPATPNYSGLGGVTPSQRTQMVRQPISHMRMWVGESLASGYLTFLRQTNNNRNHHYILTIANHQMTAVDMYFAGEVPIYPEDLDQGGWVQRGKYKGKLRLRAHLGSPDQDADPDLLAAVPDLDANFRGRSVAYIWIELDYDRSTFPNGVPNIKVLARGAKPYDPRTGETVYSPNSMLVTRHYLTDQRLGQGYDADRIDDAVGNASANICDEIVDTRPVDQVVRSVDAAGDWLELDGERLLFERGDRVTVGSTGDLPGGVAAGTAYYVIPLHHRAWDDDDDDEFEVFVRVALAATYRDALAGVAVALSSVGSGTITVTKTGEPRYTSHGLLSSERPAKDHLADLYSAFGALVVLQGAKWRVMAAGWVAPTVAFDDGDIAGPIRVATEVPHRDRANAVRGVYVSALNDWEESDYPPWRNATQLAADGGGNYTYRNLSLPLTNRSATAQRLAKIDERRLRVGGESAVLPLKLTGLLVGAGDTCTMHTAAWDFGGAALEVTDWQFALTRGEDDSPVPGTQISVRRTSAEIFAFDPSTEESATPPAKSVTGSRAFTVAAPGPVTLESGTPQLLVNADGTVTPQIRASWPALADRFVTSGGRVRVGFRVAGSAGDFRVIEVVGGETEAFLGPVVSAVDYEVRWQAENSIGVESAWSDPVVHTVIGKTADPSNVPSLSCQQNGAGLVTYQWGAIPDADLDGYELRYTRVGSWDWSAGTLITAVTRGTLITNAALPPGSWTVGIKARDTSGNYSAVAATSNITVTGALDIIYQATDGPRWLGALDGLIRHDVSGRLIPATTTLAVDLDDAALWDRMSPDPVASGVYTTAPVDLMYDAVGARVWAEIAGGLGPGEAGAADSRLQIRFAADGEPWSPWADWAAGSVDARHIQARVLIDPATGAGWLDRLRLVIDVAERSEPGRNQAVAAGGTSVVFVRPFARVPLIQVTAAGAAGAARYATYEDETQTGFVARVWDAAGNDVGGQINWTATGP